MTAIAEIIVLTAANVAAVLADAQDGECFAIHTPTNGLVTLRLQTNDAEPYLGENGEVVAEFGKYLTVTEDSPVQEFLTSLPVTPGTPVNPMNDADAAVIAAMVAAAAKNYPYKHLRYLLGDGPMDRYQGPCGSDRGDVIFGAQNIAEVLASGRYEIR